MLNKILYPVIGLLILFLLAYTLILPYFRTTYEYGFGTEPCSRTGCTASSSSTSLINSYCKTKTTSDIPNLACANCNTTTGYEFFLANCHSLNAWNNQTYCFSCTNFGFKSTSTGLMLLVLVLALIGFAVYYLPKIKR